MESFDGRQPQLSNTGSVPTTLMEGTKEQKLGYSDDDPERSEQRKPWNPDHTEPPEQTQEPVRHRKPWSPPNETESPERPPNETESPEQTQKRHRKPWSPPKETESPQQIQEPVRHRKPWSPPMETESPQQIQPPNEIESPDQTGPSASHNPDENDQTQVGPPGGVNYDNPDNGDAFLDYLEDMDAPDPDHPQIPGQQSWVSQPKKPQEPEGPGRVAPDHPDHARDISLVAGQEPWLSQPKRPHAMAPGPYGIAQVPPDEQTDSGGVSESSMTTGKEPRRHTALDAYTIPPQHLSPPLTSSSKHLDEPLHTAAPLGKEFLTEHPPPEINLMDAVDKIFSYPSAEPNDEKELEIVYKNNDDDDWDAMKEEYQTHLDE
eukprot:gene10667-3246_t